MKGGWGPLLEDGLTNTFATLSASLWSLLFHIESLLLLSLLQPHTESLHSTEAL